MYTVVKRLHFCYGHRLLDYPGKCAHPHGHNAVVEIELSGKELDRLGMLADFSDVSRRIGGFVDRELDHKMILRKDDPVIPVLTDLGEPVFTMDKNPTAENIAELIFRFAQSEGLPVVSVRLWETPDAQAEFRE